MKMMAMYLNKIHFLGFDSTKIGNKILQFQIHASNFKIFIYFLIIDVQFIDSLK